MQRHPVSRGQPRQLLGRPAAQLLGWNTLLYTGLEFPSADTSLSFSKMVGFSAGWSSGEPICASGSSVGFVAVSRNEELRRSAVAIVSNSGRCTANQLVSALRHQCGASIAEANRTLLELIRDGYVKRTFFGELFVRAPGGRAHGGYPVAVKVIGVVLILAIGAFIAWGFYKLFAGNNGGPASGVRTGGQPALLLATLSTRGSVARCRRYW